MSKGLKDFKELKKTTCFYCQYHINEECANGECIWNNIEKSLKALEIIKYIWGDRILTDIEKHFVLGSPYIKLPSEEQYDLLKEVLL